MRKRIISLVLALTMICAMAISASASSYNTDGWYEESYWELVDSCEINKVAAATLCDSTIYLVQANATATAIDEFDKEPDSNYVEYEYVGTPSLAACSVGGVIYEQVLSVFCEHMVNGHTVQTVNLYP